MEKRKSLERERENKSIPGRDSFDRSPIHKFHPLPYPFLPIPLFPPVFGTVSYRAVEGTNNDGPIRRSMIHRARPVYTRFN